MFGGNLFTYSLLTVEVLHLQSIQVLIGGIFPL